MRPRHAAECAVLTGHNPRGAGKIQNVELCIDQVTKSYGRQTALHAFTLTLRPGVLALLGPNGAGKTTLMN